MKNLSKKNAKMDCEVQNYKVVMCAYAFLLYSYIPERFYMKMIHMI